MYYFTGKNPELKKIGYSLFRKNCLSYGRKFEDSKGRYEPHMYVAGGMGIRFSSIEYQYIDTIIEFVLANKDKDEYFWGTNDESDAYMNCSYVLTTDNEIVNREQLLEKAKIAVQESYPDKHFPDDVMSDFADMKSDAILAVRFLPHLVSNIIELNNISELVRR